MKKSLKDILLLLSLGCIILLMAVCGLVDEPKWVGYLLGSAVCLWLIPAYRHWKNEFDVFDEQNDDEEDE